MPLSTIFLVRHGFRSNWTTDRVTGETVSSVKSPTNIPSDPALSAYGALQAQELSLEAKSLDPPVARVYTSPFYRCIQTIEPLRQGLGEHVPLICDRGLGEWYGLARFTHPTAADLGVLTSFFPRLEEQTTIIPSQNGEGIDELHDRCAYALARIIANVDTMSSSSEAVSIVICSHAASIIAMARALTGHMPSDPNEADFDTYTCSISRFQRLSSSSEEPPPWTGSGKPPALAWRGGRGVGGGWECLINAAVGHLTNGAERNWHFSGDESFLPEKESKSPKSLINKGSGSRL